MKISKLFHWLYAILMFLPIMVFIPNAFYYGFNEHAVAQEKTEQIPVYYESNAVNSISDLVIGNVYRLNIDISYVNTSNQNGFLMFYSLLQNTCNINTISAVIQQDTPYIRFTTNSRVKFLILDNDQQFNIESSGYMDFVYKGIFNSPVFIDYITECTDLYIKEYQPLTTNMSITGSMSYAWDSTWQNDLFSWSYDSFLTQPFLYITNLFNVPATNTLVYCLSYWLNISIIWLVFDVIMYVPLLVHRWLDKGIVE